MRWIYCTHLMRKENQQIFGKLNIYIKNVNISSIDMIECFKNLFNNL